MADIGKIVEELIQKRVGDFVDQLEFGDLGDGDETPFGGWDNGINRKLARLVEGIVEKEIERRREEIEKIILEKLRSTPLKIYASASVSMGKE